MTSASTAPTPLHDAGAPPPPALPHPTAPVGGPSGGLPGDPPAPQRYRGRIGGLDLARGLAVLGMFYAHVAPRDDEAPPALRLLATIPDGRSSVLFALLAGVSLAILTGRNVAHTGQEARTSRLRILGRSVMLLVIAGALSSLGTYVGIILAFYAAWFVAALPFAHWPAARLLRAAAVVAVAGPLAGVALEWLAGSLGLWLVGDANSFVLQVFVSGNYAGASYMAFVLAGMGIGRLDITRTRIRATLVGVGALLMVAGYLTSWALTQAVGAQDDSQATATTAGIQAPVTATGAQVPKATRLQDGDGRGGAGARDLTGAATVLGAIGAPGATSPAPVEMGTAASSAVGHPRMGDAQDAEEDPDPRITQDSEPSDDELNPWFPTNPEIEAPAPYPGTDLDWDPQPAPEPAELVSAEAHSGTVLETVGSGGCAIMVLGLCLLAGSWARHVLRPLAAVGSMALTAYSAQFLVLAFHKEWVVTDSWGPFAVLALGTMAGTFAWGLVARRGPLEWVMWKASVAMARA